jgi:hypothetical protein
MANPKVDVRPHANKRMSNMEYSIVHSALAKVKEGVDAAQLAAFLEKEIQHWKIRDKYKNTLTRLDTRSRWEMALMNGTTELLIFKTIM